MKLIARLALALLLAVPSFAGSVAFSGRFSIGSGLTLGQWVETADLDNDGDLDAVAVTWGGEVSWWANPGGPAGSSWTKRTIATGFNGGQFLRLVDLDNDGQIDVLGSALTVRDVTWWRNPGDGGIDGSSWTAHTIDDDTQGLMSIQAADLDRDGDLDVLAAAWDASDGGVIWWENPGGPATTDGTPWPERHIESAVTDAIATRIADLDRDGDLDVVGGDWVAGALYWWENPGPASVGGVASWSRSTIATGFAQPWSIELHDIDRDGDLDAVSSNLSAGVNNWWENPGDLTITSPWTVHAIGPDSTGDSRSLVPGDLDLDGDPDLVRAMSGSLSWRDNPGGAATGDGTVWTRRELDTLTYRRAVPRDIDRDGDADIVAIADGGVYWFENRTIHREAIYPFAETVAASLLSLADVQPLDVDHDGDLDLLAFAEDPTTAITWRRNPSMPSAVPWDSFVVRGAGGAARSGSSADVDQDGDADVIAAAGDAVLWLENPADPTASPGAPWSEYVLDATFLSAQSAVPGDLDGDGDPDILGAGAAGLTWWENPGGVDARTPASWTAHALDAAYDSAANALPFDVDGDGDLDVVACSSGGAETIVWRENPGGAATTDGTPWTERAISGASAFTSLVIVDINSDGLGDIVAAGSAGLRWWLHPGSVTALTGAPWTQTVIAATPVDVMTTADLDGDADSDIFVSAADAGAWFANPNGAEAQDPSLWIEQSVSLAAQGAALAAADVDRDGDLDLVEGATAGALQWFENRGGQFALPTAPAPDRFLRAGATPLLVIAARNNGRDGDGEVELASLELLLETTDAVPLEDADANASINALSVYVDDALGAGAGDFQEDEDTLVATMTSFTLDEGVVTLTILDNNPDARVAVDAPETFFITVDFADSPTISSLQITHVTEASSTAENRIYDTPLSLSYAANVTADLVTERFLSVATTGDGSGSVVSLPAGIDCPATACMAGFTPDGVVTLTATPAPGSALTGWSGCDSTDGDECTVTMDADYAVTAEFTMLEVLTLTLAGDGAGSVTSVPDGVDCPAVDCAVGFIPGTEVVLTAAPASGSELQSWSGCETTDGLECTVSVSSATAVTATFRDLRTLDVNVAGAGTGSVESAPAGVDCPGGACTADFSPGTAVTLTASPAAGSGLASWTGCDTANGPVCTVTLDVDRAVSATFLPVHDVSVTLTGDGTGSVMSAPAGIDCPALQCSADFLEGAAVTLTATPAANSDFIAWTGCDSFDGATCTVSIAAAAAVEASFARRFSVTVLTAGDGAGSVHSAPSGVDCPGSGCTVDYPGGTALTLTATPALGSELTSWSGCDSIDGALCLVTLTTDKAVTVTFTELEVLTVVHAGTGSGSTVSVPAGIDCPGLCSVGVQLDQTMTLTAIADADSDFTSWSGCDSVNGPVCTVTFAGAGSVTASFTLRPRLTVQIAGSGDGGVTSSPAGIQCPGLACSAHFEPGTTVTLMPAIGSGADFAAWTGCDSVDGAACTVTLESNDRSVIASFEGPQMLRVLVVGDGRVTSSPAGIDCPATECQTTFNHGDTVTLTATPGANATFSGWNGCPASSGNQCTVTMASEQAVSASFVEPSFVPSPRSLTLTAAGDADPVADRVFLGVLNGPADFHIVAGASWLSASPSSGTVQNGTPAIVELIADPGGLPEGDYAAMAVVRAHGEVAATISVLFVVTAPSAPPGQTIPVVYPGGVVNAAGPSLAGVAPGAVVSIFGSGFVGTDEVYFAQTLPLPLELGGVSVMFDGSPGRIFYVSHGQINVQVPWGAVGADAEVVVANPLGTGGLTKVPFATYSPAIFTAGSGGVGQAVVTFANTATYVAPVGGVAAGLESRPARAGDILTIYANGLGPVSPPIADGAASCVSGADECTLRRTIATPTVRIGGVAVPPQRVLYSGLAPGFAGLYMINWYVPEGTPVGDSVLVTLEIGGVTSPPATTIAVEESAR